MNTRCRFFIFLLLIFSGTRMIAGAVPPSITIGEAVGANPATVYTAGKTTRLVNVTWNAGTAYTHCEIYYTTNGANQTELARGHDGTTPTLLTAGSAYQFWMVIYPGSGQFLIVAKLNVVAKQGSITPPPPASGSTSRGNGTGGFDERAGSKAGPIIDFQNAPFISDVRVQPDARNVIISFATTQVTPPLIEIGKVPPAKDRFGVYAFPNNSGAFTRFVPEEKGRYVLNVDAQGARLDIGTNYHYIINVFNNNRNDTRRPREQSTGQFSTWRQTVKIVWSKIYLADDSDDLSTAEGYFWFWANHGEPTGVYTEYSNGDMDSGESYAFGGSVVIPNAPDKLKLHASGQDADGTTLIVSGVPGTQLGRSPVRHAGDHSVPGTENSDTNATSTELDLSTYPGNSVTVPFTMATQGGSLKFVVDGYVEITRQPVEQIGTSSAALQSDANSIQAGRRVRTRGGSARDKPLSICEAAREARARNNPAAAGLESKCLAESGIKPGRRVDPQSETERTSPSICESAKKARELNNAAAPGLEQKCLASKGEEIAEGDATLLAARKAETDPYYAFGFDVATAIFGDPALGAQGNTLTGPGSMGIRSRLNAAGQRGFDAALKLHLSRNYRR